ncbi:hypothetical protein ACFXD5_26465 [Streptomyces sp. NPDC059385]|uniref:AMIN-like domain-containing (lipo)protein n=1 Tax=Streptomyces sp. NPDC059385 TaxID=3346817 RepID=UPI0036B39DF4
MIHTHLRRIVALASGALLTVGLPLAAPAATASTATAIARTQSGAPLVVDARWGGHPTYDRIVIDIRGYVPTATVTPVRQLVHDGSGTPVPLPGRYFLEIRLTPAAAHDDAGGNVYHGPRSQRIDLPKLKGLALTGDFEGYVTFGAAFDTLPYYRAFPLHSPERFVVDVAR